MIHVYPNCLVEDAAHHADHQRLLRVVEPFDECWLCREGICVQRIERGLAGPDGETITDIVFHGTEPAEAH